MNLYIFRAGFLTFMSRLCKPLALALISCGIPSARWSMVKQEMALLLQFVNYIHKVCAHFSKLTPWPYFPQWILYTPRLCNYVMNRGPNGYWINVIKAYIPPQFLNKCENWCNKLMKTWPNEYNWLCTYLAMVCLEPHIHYTIMNSLMIWIFLSV